VAGLRPRRALPARLTAAADCSTGGGWLAARWVSQSTQLADLAATLRWLPCAAWAALEGSLASGGPWLGLRLSWLARAKDL